jgi:dolichyl-diphosphooligosaccharide--protein glycosyltransferase/undecaprenyl-diphosphooligosaccharide--protein glycosyltransferase
MVGLGFLAAVGGLRFTIYAVPILAFGVAFLITEISRKMPNNALKYSSIVVLTLLALYPNYKHIEAYKVPTVFNATEVKILDKIQSIADREDYVVTWWDYGYPIRYYADVKTLIDGGKHVGAVNYPVSFILTSPQNVAAKMARLDVEFTEKAFAQRAEENSTQKIFSNIEEMTKAYGFSDTNKFLRALPTIKPPKKTRDIYLYLPYKMLNILPTVTLFSNMDLMTGKKNKAPFFFVSRNFKDSTNRIDFGRGISLDKKNGSLSLGNQKVQLRRFVKTAYDKNMKLQKSVQTINVTSNISVIYMSNYNTFLIVDEKMYNSLYIQLMVLENADPTLFEPVILDPQTKVYRLKI